MIKGRFGNIITGLLMATLSFRLLYGLMQENPIIFLSAGVGIVFMATSYRKV